jgi:hypothetical protein
MTSSYNERFPRVIAAIVGLTLLFLGIWALVAPRVFFESIAVFEPYNQHFVQDLGAFQLGLGAVLLIAAFATSDALVAGLLGVGFGAAAHVVSHVVGRDLGGNPGLDLPGLSLLAVLLLVGGGLRWRGTRGADHRGLSATR